MSYGKPLSGHDDGDATYIEKTLRHTPTDLLLDETPPGVLLRAAWRRSVKGAFGTFIVCLIVWIFTSAPFLGSNYRGSYENGAGNAATEDGSGNAFTIIGVLAPIIVFVVSWIAFLAGEKQEAISEWCTLLGGRSEAANSVYSHIAGGLRERRLPIQNYLVKRTPTRFGATGNRLVLVDGYHYVYVSVFSYGTGLYLGWTMWRVRAGSFLVRQYFIESAANGGGGPLSRILNLERLKAMREAVHAVCREALHAAIENVEIPEYYGFPSGMPPIEVLPYGGAPRPTTGQQWIQPPHAP